MYISHKMKASENECHLFATITYCKQLALFSFACQDSHVMSMMSAFLHIPVHTETTPLLLLLLYVLIFSDPKMLLSC